MSFFLSHPQWKTIAGKVNGAEVGSVRRGRMSSNELGQIFSGQIQTKLTFKSLNELTWAGF